MFSKSKTFVALSFVALATLFGCMKMDTTVTEPVLNIAESGFDTPLNIPTVLNPQSLTLEAKTSQSTLLKGKTTANALLYNGAIPVIRVNKGDAFNVNLKNSL